MNAYKLESSSTHGKECECSGHGGICHCKVKCRACAERLRSQEAEAMFPALIDGGVTETVFTSRTFEFLEGDQ
jgi:hypothetical protein